MANSSEEGATPPRPLPQPAPGDRLPQGRQRQPSLQDRRRRSRDYRRSLSTTSQDNQSSSQSSPLAQSPKQPRHFDSSAAVPENASSQRTSQIGSTGIEPLSGMAADSIGEPEGRTTDDLFSSDDEEAGLFTDAVDLLGSSAFIYPSYGDRLKELLINLQICRVKIALLSDTPEAVKFADGIISNAIKNADKLKYKPLRQRCQFWKGMVLYRITDFDAALRNFEEARQCVGKYEESDWTSEWIMKAKIEAKKKAKKKPTVIQQSSGQKRLDVEMKKRRASEGTKSREESKEPPQITGAGRVTSPEPQTPPRKET